MSLKDNYKKRVGVSTTETKATVKEIQKKTEANVSKNGAEGNEKKVFAKKIDKIYAKMGTGDAFLEVLEDGFNLVDEEKGYETKVHFNFSQLDKNQKQKDFMSHYLNLTSFLYLRNMFVTGEYVIREEEERASLGPKKKFCESIYSEYKKPNDELSSTFYVTPGMKQGTWMVGVVEVNTKERKSRRIQIPVTTERLIGSLELIYLAYQKNIFLKK